MSAFDLLLDSLRLSPVKLDELKQLRYKALNDYSMFYKCLNCPLLIIELIFSS